VIHQITSEQAHLGLAYNVGKDPQIRVETSASQPLAALVKKAGIYDIAVPLDFKSLATMPCAIPPKGFGIGVMIAAAEAKHGTRLRAVVETGSIAALKSFARNDMGLTILPKFVVDSELSAGTLTARPITSSAFPNGVSSLLRKEGRKLPQAAHLMLPYLKAMSAFS
jgi:DNA-binding transcriptional LysR family regulator